MLGAVAVPRLNWMRAKTYFEVEVIKPSFFDDDLQNRI